ncbi:MAG: ribosome small subunit-dependent GTPase A [Eubacteriaceae bacterium]|nr:ribosome small subunit-dependent GTPase A [Eubacteriaceae bacterium]
MIKGLIVKGIGGFYYVKTDEQVYQCRARGIFRDQGVTPMIGDIVDIEVQDDGDAVVDRIYPRKNEFLRPPVSNIDMMVVVAAAARPKPNTAVIDKLLVAAEKSSVEIMICINKIDIAEPQIVAGLKEIYEKIYPLVLVSGKTGEGIDGLKEHLAGKRSAFAGPSGAGKSTLLNRLQPSIEAETGSVSSKTKRGRHTTRHVEIFDMDFGGMVYDTPGFTSFDTSDADLGELQFYFPEMRPYIGKCRYDNCRHLKEPDCAVTAAVEAGKISRSRYDSYTAQYKDIEEKNKY